MASWKNWVGRRRGMWIALAAVVVVLVAARIALPHFIKDHVNRRLDEIPEYDGMVGDIDVALLRGAYVIDGMELVKTEGKVEIPFVKADRVDLSVEWGALMEGSFVGEITFERAELNFIKGPSGAQSQRSIDESWLPAVEALFPLRINKFEITDGEVHYRDDSGNPPFDMFIDSVYVVATNLTNSKDISESLFAVIDGEGLAMRQAPIKVHVETDPNAEHKTFDLNLSLRNLPLVKLNKMVKSYAGFDFEKGTFNVDTELAASNGRIKGYVKPIFHDVKILDLEDDADNPLKVVWESVVTLVGKVFTNQSEDQMATMIPVTGRTDHPNTSIITIVSGLLRNAFIEALKPGVEGTVDLDEVLTKKKQEAARETKKELKEEKKEDEGG
jgi:hypothetical protein